MLLDQAELQRLIRTTKKEDIIGDPRSGKAYIKTKGSGVHSVYVDLESGETTEEVHELVKVSTFDECDHFYVQIDDHNIQCKNCGLGHQFVQGLQLLENGKIIENK